MLQTYIKLLTRVFNNVFLTISSITEHSCSMSTRPTASTDVKFSLWITELYISLCPWTGNIWHPDRCTRTVVARSKWYPTGIGHLFTYHGGIIAVPALGTYCTIYTIFLYQNWGRETLFCKSPYSDVCNK